MNYAAATTDPVPASLVDLAARLLPGITVGRVTMCNGMHVAYWYSATDENGRYTVYGQTESDMAEKLRLARKPSAC